MAEWSASVILESSQPITPCMLVRIFCYYFLKKIICIILLLFKRIACRLARAAKRINICPIKILPGGYAQVMECL